MPLLSVQHHWNYWQSLAQALVAWAFWCLQLLPLACSRKQVMDRLRWNDVGGHFVSAGKFSRQHVCYMHTKSRLHSEEYGMNMLYISQVWLYMLEGNGFY